MGTSCHQFRRNCKSIESPTKPFPHHPTKESLQMKRSLLAASLALAVAICLIGIVPLANAAAGDSTIFFMTKSAGAVPCLNINAIGRGHDQRPATGSEHAH